MPRVAQAKPADATAKLGFEAKLWLAADKLRDLNLTGTLSLVCSGAVSAPAGSAGSAVADRRYRSHCSVVLRGRVCEPFLTQFANAEGKNGGQFDVRWQFGVPPKGNANFAWVQHFIQHLVPQGTRQAAPLTPAFSPTPSNPAPSPPCATRCCRSC